MENKNYKVCRDDIYVGRVIRTDGIYFTAKSSEKQKVTTSAYISYRSILFIPDENKLSNDLLYKSPSYPILNITDDEECLKLNGDIKVIKYAYNLSSLLQYFGYEKELTFDDIMKIRKTFFTGKFAKDHCELFGYKETKPEEYEYYKNGFKITNPVELKLYIMKEKILQLMEHKSFSSGVGSVLPSEYWNILDCLGDNSLTDVLSGKNKRMNAFVPHKEEGPIKKLTKF